MSHRSVAPRIPRGWVFPLVLGGLLAQCTDWLAPPSTGGITLQVVVAAGSPHAVAADAAAGPTSGEGPDFAIAGFTSVRACADGPSDKCVNLQLVSGFWQGNLDQLDPGTYQACVWGSVGSSIDRAGERIGIQVQAGRDTPASVVLTSFRPTIDSTRQTGGSSFRVFLGAVPCASAYLVEVDDDPVFSPPIFSSSQVTQRMADVSGPAFGTFYVRARALAAHGQGEPGGAVSFALLVVAAAGSGTGVVTGPGINCTIAAGVVSGDCTEPYDAGTPVTLTAQQAVDSRFAGWSGACTGTGTCQVAMTAGRAVTATFTQRFTLSVAGVGSGSGTVTGPGIACTITAGVASGDCTELYDVDSSVTLMAQAAADSRFAGWVGDCGGAGTCQVTMTGARAVTATFSDGISLIINFDDLVEGDHPLDRLADRGVILRGSSPPFPDSVFTIEDAGPNGDIVFPGMSLPNVLSYGHVPGPGAGLACNWVLRVEFVDPISRSSRAVSAVGVLTFATGQVGAAIRVRAFDSQDRLIAEDQFSLTATNEPPYQSRRLQVSVPGIAYVILDGDVDTCRVYDDLEFR